jgi:HlyD family secretion protein
MPNSVEKDLQALRIDRERRQVPRRASGAKAAIYFGLLSSILIIAGWMIVPKYLAKAPEVEVATVVATPKGNPSMTVLTAGGYVVAREKVEVGSKMPGRIETLLVKEGDFVKKGDVIARLESDDLQAQVRQAQANLAAARARLKELEAGSRQQEIEQARAAVQQAEANAKDAELNLQRMRKLVSQGVLAAQVLDTAQTQYDVAQAQLKSAREHHDLVRTGPRVEQIESARAQVHQAEATLQYSQTQLENTIIRSPISGRVLEKLVERGEMVATGFAGGGRGIKTALVTLAQPDDLEVELDINETEIHKLKLNQPATIVADAFPDKSYKGRLARFMPQANRQKSTLQVKVKVLDPDEQLRPEMSAKVSFVEEASAAAEPSKLLVPKEAIVQRGGAPIVFVVEESKSVARPVKLGKEYGGKMEVLGGLRSGEVVVVKGLEAVKDGERVLIKR